MATLTVEPSEVQLKSYKNVNGTFEIHRFAFKTKKSAFHELLDFLADAYGVERTQLLTYWKGKFGKPSFDVSS